jgi:hypothetical protein
MPSINYVAFHRLTIIHLFPISHEESRLTCLASDQGVGE